MIGKFNIEKMEDNLLPDKLKYFGKSIKRLIYDPTITDCEKLISIFKEEHYRIIYNESFYKKWEEKFL